ncbi:Probable RNA-directed DNA polymerase from transposon BS [Eumeta japonica]|uniref:Probable RNA-directed DNA polymerase from transposon BS n=1 Tax=Eumeta variegata TaxID=151549 RepID=A0A4C1SZM6_EUMVA|nr:Probable RNA-directed DNA polymerase from transposon BS [Eumeta japonica]
MLALSLCKHIFGACEDSRDTIGIFCDLSKAFDCVYHESLIVKPRHYGVTGRALDLLKSYLSNRVQRVDVNGMRSSGSIVHMGVPQESILGSFLFLIYINDLPSLVKDVHEILLFADDTSLLFKVKRRQPTYENNAIWKVEKWLTTNNLLLNEMKTICIKFSFPNVRHGSRSISVRNKELEFVNSTVFLGITLDNRLQWGPHISELAKRLNFAVYAVKKMRNLSDVETARLVYFGCFHSLMSYGILLWGNAVDIHRIFVLQKRTVRAIYKLGPRTSLRNKFKEIEILTLAS